MVTLRSVPAVEPDRNGLISFARFDPRLGDLSIWTANPDGTHQRRLTHLRSYDSDWSPSGRLIVLDFNDHTGEHLATINPDGTHLRRLTSQAGIQEEPTWSPHGRRIVFDASATLPDQPGFRTDIWTIRADGTDARQLTHGIFAVEPVYSPDGHRIAFGRIAGTDPQGRQLEAIDVVNTNGKNLREIVPPRPDLEHPAWSSDGAWISFSIPPEGPHPAVLAVHPDGKGLRTIRRSDRRFGLFNAVWSPDAQKLLVGCHDFRDDLDKLCTMNGDGSGLHVEVEGRYRVNTPAWGTHPLRR
jgi:Tol biopolymer transport system component